jgi:hypothetical protein
MIDVFVSAPWYVDHIAPIWLALPPEARGLFHVTPRAAPAAVGLPNVTPKLLNTGDPRRPVLVVSYGDLRASFMAQRRHIALGQHGAGQSYSTDHPAYPGGRNQGPASLHLVPNEHAADRTRKAYPNARVEIIGCPRLDSLPRPKLDPNRTPVVAFSFHWDGPSIAPELRSAWQYYRMNVASVKEVATVIGHAHPRAMPRVARWYTAQHIEIMPDFADVLKRADLYVCDNSSSLFEFASTGRPVVVMNAPIYRRNVEHGLRFWSAANVGLNVERGSRLAATVETALADPPEVLTQREAALRTVYQPLSGGTRLATAALLDWC